MANWQNRLDLADLWKKQKASKLTIIQVSQEVAKRLKKLQKKLVNQKAFKDYAYDLIEIISNFEYCGEDVDEFDSYLEELYNWADTPIGHSDSFAQQKKLCWIATF